MEAFESFFDLIDNDVDNISSIVTDDFYIFENSRRYSKEEFIEFVKGFDIIEVKRDFKNIDIDSDYNSAHITLTQLAEAKVNTPDGKEKMNFEWLESAYLIKENKSITLNSLNEDQKTTLMSLSGVKDFPMRVKCATMAWHTLSSVLEKK